MTSSSKSVAVLGAGISGLATAYALKKRGLRVTLFEARDRVGGPVESVQQDGYLLENGPHTLLLRSPRVRDLLDEIGVLKRAIDADVTASRRYILKDGSPRELPGGPRDLLRTEALSRPALLRLLAEPLIRRFDDEEIDETLAAFVERRLGKEVLDYLVDPFVAGIWAGNPDQLSARHAFPLLKSFEDEAGSIILGGLKSQFSRLKATRANPDASPSMQRRLLSFQGGMGDLVQAFANHLTDEIRLSSPVLKIRRDDDSWRVIFGRGKGRRGESFDALVSTLPTHRLPHVTWETGDDTAQIIDELSTMAYAPCNLVQLGFDRQDINDPLEGLGLLIPRVEYFDLLGILYVSSMFPGRAPEGKVLLSCFIGGARQPHLASLDDHETLHRTLHVVRRILGIHTDPEFHRIKRWHQAIPQYEVGHDYYRLRIDALEARHAGLFFAGNFSDSIGLPALLEASLKHDQRIATYLAE